MEEIEAEREARDGERKDRKETKDSKTPLPNKFLVRHWLILLSMMCRERAGHSVTSTDAKSPRGDVTASRRASDCTLKLEEIVHNLAYADRRLQVC